MTNTTKPAAQGRSAVKPTRAQRPKRVSMSGSRKRMHIPEEYQDPEFHYAWISDQGDLLFRAKRAGYEHVSGSEMPMMVFDVDAGSDGTGPIHANGGKGVTQYLLKQPMEFHKEDLDEQREINRARIADIKKDLNSGKDGTYGKVEIS